ncbi:hypothetical protein GW17_00013758 [Ensete ventricosum]|nr:hypothetical protein GW17_00013758 [Ensete ventricosum]
MILLRASASEVARRLLDVQLKLERVKPVFENPSDRNLLDYSDREKVFLKVQCDADGSILVVCLRVLGRLHSCISSTASSRKKNDRSSLVDFSITIDFLAFVFCDPKSTLSLYKRNLKTNIGIVAFTIFLCAVIILIQKVAAAEEMNKDGHRYSSLNQFGANPISRSFGWLALLRVLRPPSRAVTSDDPTPAGLPGESCKVSRSCSASVLFSPAVINPSHKVSDSLAMLFVTEIYDNIMIARE